MNKHSFLMSGFCFSCFFHFVSFVLVAPKAAVIPDVRPKTESVFLGSILNEVDVVPPRTSLVPSRRVDLPSMTGNGASGRFKEAGPHSDKPFSMIPQQERSEFPQESVFLARPVPGDTLTFSFMDAGRYFLNIDFSDIAKNVARDQFSGVLEYEVFVSGRGDVERLRRILGSGDPVLDNAIGLRLKMAVLKSPWAQEGARYHLRLLIKPQEITRDPN